MNRVFTDVYLIAALISYGFRPVDIDTKNTNRQKYAFSDTFKKDVFIFDEGKLTIMNLTLEEVEMAYINTTLCFPPNYPTTLKQIKYAIVSNRMNDDY